MHCYQPVGTIAVTLVNMSIIGEGGAVVIGEGETVIIAAVDHNDAQLHYALVSPLHPVEMGPFRRPWALEAPTILAGYERFEWTWASAASLFFPEASELFPDGQ